MTNENQIQKLFKEIIFADKKIFIYISGYAIIVAILYLALPLSVQIIINRVTHTALLQPVVIMSIVLMFLLALSAILTVLQKYLLEIYKRISFVRISSDLFIKGLYADKKQLKKELTNDLSDKYFEIFNVQDTMAVLFIEGLLVALQLAAGFILSSFYHPYLFIINIITMIVIVITWKVFKKSAIDTAIVRSQNKYNVYAWFDNVLFNSFDLRNTSSHEFALNKSHQVIGEYIKSRINYWKIHLAQTIILTVLYSLLILAIFSIGSALVVRGQLTLGQLVASEIIFMSSLVGISKLPTYFDYYYNLIASVDKMKYLINLEEDSQYMINKSFDNEALFEYKQVIVKANDNTYNFDMTISSQKLQRVRTKSEDESILLLELMNYQTHIENKIIILDEIESNYNTNVFNVDNTGIYTTEIIMYLTNKTNSFDYVQVENLLFGLGLLDKINKFPDKLHTEIINDSLFTLREVVLLKICKAILIDAECILIGGLARLLDQQDFDNLAKVFSSLKKTKLIIVDYEAQRGGDYVV
ncbi:MAG: ABC transporter transmembrane domain-containing protein [Burkholderiales bacterium]|nr:ABC transporter transmembrane domain-containing protein [Burkholderiales bacterium]